MDGIVEWVDDYVTTAYRQWQIGTRQTLQAFADDLQPWLDEQFENPDGRDVRHEWAAFIGRWSARIDVDAQSYANFEEWLVQHVEHGCSCCCDDSEPAALAAAPVQPASPARTDDSYFASEEERDSLQAPSPSNEEASVRQAQPLSVPSGEAEASETSKYGRPEKFHPERVLPPDSKFTPADVVLALQVAHAIEVRFQRILDLQHVRLRLFC